MIGEKIDVAIEGPGMMMDDVKPTIDGDSKDIALENKPVTFVDAAAVLAAERVIHISLINRSVDKEQTVEIGFPAGYRAESVWELNHRNINASNTANNRFEIVPATRTIKSTGKKITLRLPACGLAMLKLVTK